MNDTPNLNTTIDASVWADEWLRVIAMHPEIPTDRDAMIGWFSNALVVGYDEGWRARNSALKVERHRGPQS